MNESAGAICNQVGRLGNSEKDWPQDTMLIRSGGIFLHQKEKGNHVDCPNRLSPGSRIA